MSDDYLDVKYISVYEQEFNNYKDFIGSFTIENTMNYVNYVAEKVDYMNNNTNNNGLLVGFICYNYIINNLRWETSLNTYKNLYADYLLIDSEILETHVDNLHFLVQLLFFMITHVMEASLNFKYIKLYEKSPFYNNFCQTMDNILLQEKRYTFDQYRQFIDFKFASLYNDNLENVINAIYNLENDANIFYKQQWTPANCNNFRENILTVLLTLLDETFIRTDVEKRDFEFLDVIEKVNIDYLQKIKDAGIVPNEDKKPKSELSTDVKREQAFVTFRDYVKTQLDMWFNQGKITKEQNTDKRIDEITNDFFSYSDLEGSYKRLNNYFEHGERLKEVLTMEQKNELERLITESYYRVRRDFGFDGSSKTELDRLHEKYYTYKGIKEGLKEEIRKEEEEYKLKARSNIIDFLKLENRRVPTEAEIERKLKEIDDAGSWETILEKLEEDYKKLKKKSDEMDVLILELSHRDIFDNFFDFVEEESANVILLE